MATASSTTDEMLDDVAGARRLLRMMLLIRRFEERTEEQYTRARIGGYCHLAIGEEAANVGAIDASVEGDYLFASYRDHGAALAVGSDPAAVMAELFGKAPASPAATAARCTCSTSSATSSAAGASSAASCRSPSAPRWRSTTQSAERGALSSSATARPTSARSTRRSTWRRSGICRSSSRSSTTCYGMGTSVERRLGRAGAVASARRPTACTASASTATTCWPCARRAEPPAATARARSARPRCWRRLTYRFRGHSVADAGKVYRSEDEVDGGARARSDPALRDPLAAAGRARRRGGQGACAREVNERGRRGDPRGGRRHPAPDPAGALRQRLRRRRDWREQFAPHARRRPVRRAGGDALVADVTYREALRRALDEELDARRARLPDGRGDRALRGLLQGHRRASGRSTARSACARRRSPRRASSAPASARRCSACGPSSRS